MIYIVVFALLIAIELLYFRIALKYRIVDVPNDRSSHAKPTLLGGGVIFWVAALLYLVVNPSQQTAWIFAGLTVIATVSFVDDIVGLRQKVRLIFQVVSISFAFLALGIYGKYPWWAILIGYFVFAGILNAYNFMDGINGMTGLCSLVILGSLQYVNLNITRFVDPDLIWYPMIASVVFLFFNFRKKAKCFAGDVGSIGMGFWVVMLLIRLMMQTQSLIWIGFLLVYGVENCGTIFHRILRHENLTQPHRLHFFQILVNECGNSHLVVSSAYAFTQLICSVLIIRLYPTMGWGIFAILAAILTAIYLLKFRLMIATNSPQLKCNPRRNVVVKRHIKPSSVNLKNRVECKEEMSGQMMKNKNQS
jgi:UDP-N-acetylmuramyl pentapeptide phosphotransferase/UDP-N-acetylglucosamine-1-phosphate transferase